MYILSKNLKYKTSINTVFIFKWFQFF